MSSIAYQMMSLAVFYKKFFYYGAIFKRGALTSFTNFRNLYFKDNKVMILCLYLCVMNHKKRPLALGSAILHKN
jgi:hypothetical protein